MDRVPRGRRAWAVCPVAVPCSLLPPTGPVGVLFRMPPALATVPLRGTRFQHAFYVRNESTVFYRAILSSIKTPSRRVQHESTHTTLSHMAQDRLLTSPTTASRSRVSAPGAAPRRARVHHGLGAHRHSYTHTDGPPHSTARQPVSADPVVTHIYEPSYHRVPARAKMPPLATHAHAHTSHTHAQHTRFGASSAARWRPARGVRLT